MKTIFTIIFLSVFSTFSHAQYQSLFGEESTSWDMSVWAIGIFQEFPGLIIYYAGNDTLIDGNTYTIISPDSTPPYDNTYTSYLREDPEQGKAWSFVRSGAGWEEFLIMDLSLEVGDTFAISDGHHLNQYFYPAVDSVYYHEGRKYVRLDFEYNPWNFPGEKLTFIEGVGTNIGVFYLPFQIIPVDYYTLCQNKDDTLSYVNNSPYFLGRCDVSAVGINERKKVEYRLDIFPNPTTGKITIDIPDDLIPDKSKGIIVKIMDVTGRKLLEEKVRHFPHEINGTSLPSGIYVVTVGDKAVGRFLKEE